MGSWIFLIMRGAPKLEPTEQTIDEKKITELLSVELTRITNRPELAFVSDLLVKPRREVCTWEYGQPNQEFSCWVVLEHASSNTCIAYCEEGFGPSCPWGLMFTNNAVMAMGMDSAWFSTLEEAFKSSMAWEEFLDRHERG